MSKNTPVTRGRYVYVLDNDGVPFVVFLKENIARVMRTRVGLDTDTEYYYKDVKHHDKWLEHWRDFTFIREFIGLDPCDINKNMGTSVLLEISPHEYVAISGDGIISFKTKEEIVKFVSPMGNNQVTYPYAIGSENTYLINAFTYTYLSNKLVGSADPYSIFYETDLATGKKIKSKIEQKKKADAYKAKHKLLSFKLLHPTHEPEWAPLLTKVEKKNGYSACNIM